MAEKVGAVAADVQEMFQDAQPRRNLGNIPDELDPYPGMAPRAETPEPTPASEPAPEPAPIAAESPEPEPEPEPEPTPDPTVDRVAALERELAFLRAGASPPPPPAPPPQEPPPPFTISEQDAVAMGLTPQAAKYLETAAQVIYQRARQDAVTEVVGQYGALQRNTQTAQTLQQTFHQQAPDLAAYPEIVNAAARRVEAQNPQIAQTSPHLLLGEVERLARARLSEMGIKPAAQKTVTRSRVKPARLEGGGAVRQGGTGTKGTPQERDVLQMFHDAMGTTH